MGQTLSEPITAKQSSSLQNSDVKVGSSSMQGWRISMEDAHTHILNLSEDKDSAFFGVYDGHGGAKIAAHVSKNLHKFIVRRPEYKQGNYEDAIVKAFLECDEATRKDESLKDEMSGSTAITMLYRKSKLFVGNIGDSRCIACTNGLAEPLSYDHKPCNEEEKSRIEHAGGFVEFNRVNGNLALSRAFGDFAFKSRCDLPQEQQMITSNPDVVVRDVDQDLQFVVLACDGIWDVLSNQEVADFIIKRISLGLEPEIICEELMTRCLASDSTMGGLGCDNMTVVLICFLHNQPYQNLIDECIEIEKIRDRTRLELLEREANEDDEEEELDDTDRESQATNGRDATETTS
eukprot:11246.XXX_277455_276008_1 [CDS] Oithona nana genome sequencing.